jgi:hypothetical protein
MRGKNMRELTKDELEKILEKDEKYYCPLCEGDVRGMTTKEQRGDSYFEEKKFSNGCIITLCRSCDEMYYSYLDG